MNDADADAGREGDEAKQHQITLDECGRHCAMELIVFVVFVV